MDSVQSRRRNRILILSLCRLFAFDEAIEYSSPEAYRKKQAHLGDNFYYCLNRGLSSTKMVMGKLPAWSRSIRRWTHPM